MMWYDDEMLWLGRDQLNVTVDLPSQTPDTGDHVDSVNLRTVLNDLQTTAVHLLGKNCVILASPLELIIK